MDTARIKTNIKSSIFGKFLYYFPETNSTNTFARKLAEEGAPEGTIVLTDYQSDGRGKIGRVWESEKGKNILFSVILRPRMRINDAQKLTFAIAEISIDAIMHFIMEKDYPYVKFNVKWPNDILVENRKIGGILLESSMQNQVIEYVVAGIGLNINQDGKSFSSELQKRVTSLSDIIGFEIDREILFTYLLYHFEKMYVKFERSGYRDVIERWKNHCTQIGKRAKFKSTIANENGLIKDVSPEGFLVYENDQGETKTFASGEITMVG